MIIGQSSAAKELSKISVLTARTRARSGRKACPRYAPALSVGRKLRTSRTANNGAFCCMSEAVVGDGKHCRCHAMVGGREPDVPPVSSRSVACFSGRKSAPQAIKAEASSRTLTTACLSDAGTLRDEARSVPAMIRRSSGMRGRTSERSTRKSHRSCSRSACRFESRASRKDPGRRLPRLRGAGCGSPPRV